MESTSLRKENKSKDKLRVKSEKLKVKLKIKKFSYFISGLVIFGISSLILGLFILLLTFFPIIKEEAKFALRNTNSTNSKPINPINTDFGIVIPKILANAKVIDNVDPFNSKEYQYALTKGVAHARGTAYPGSVGNIFIFAHSSSNWFTANQYNSVFYLVSKLEKGDEIDIYFMGKKYNYEVFEKKIVDPSAVEYLSNSSNSLLTVNSSFLTLMTCWPAGTDLKRLIIQAKIIN